MASGPGPSSVPIHSCLPSPKQNPFSPDLSPRLTRGSHRAFSAQQSPGYWKEKKEGERQPIAPEARTLPPRRAQKVGGRAVLAGAGWRRYLPINHWGPGLLQGQEAKAIHLEVELRGLQEGVLGWTSGVVESPAQTLYAHPEQAFRLTAVPSDTWTQTWQSWSSSSRPSVPRNPNSFSSLSRA